MTEDGHAVPPNGEIVHDVPGRFLTPGPYGRHHEKFTKNIHYNVCDVSRLLRPSTGSSDVTCHVMSTGFHQLAPIVIQAGLLRKNEIMAIENPEAHLHPSLQIEVAEFLMHQANAGKIMLIETHSDLLVRRIMRAIIEEDVLTIRNPQEAVAIHFTRLEQSENKSVKYSTVEKLKVDENGRIVWPPDFMNDYVKESRRLLDAMYGTQSEEVNDED